METPARWDREAFHGDSGVQHLDHLFEAESGLLACHRNSYTVCAVGHRCKSSPLRWAKTMGGLN